MREILLKAKRTDTREWVEGFPYYGDYSGAFILQNKPVKRRNARTGEITLRDEVFPIEVDGRTYCQYTGIDIRRPAWPSSEVHKIFTGDMLGEWGEDENGNECVCILGVVTYWESEGRYVLADENGLCNDWTLEDEAQPGNWPNLIYCGNIHDKEEEK